METNNIEITISIQQAQELWDILERIKDEWKRQEPLHRDEPMFINVDGTFCIYRSEVAAIDGIVEKLRNEFK